MVFTNAKGGKVTISLPDPLPDLTEAEVQSAMQAIIDKDIFRTSGGSLVGIAAARIVSQHTTELIED
ncbi:MAG: DUF2922 domain-containing protein [Firmicutes bacterium]|nr:DUF2922 domain-containing protein [Bacillota bacterium]